MRVAEQLDLDVARRDDPPLEIDRRVAERRSGFGARGADRGAERRGVVHRAHALAAAAGDGLHDERIADGLREARDLGVGHAFVERLLRSGHDRHARADGRFTGGGLAAHERDGFGRRPDERQPRVAARAREAGVLCQEPVAGVHRVGPGPPRGVHDRVDPQVAQGRFGRAEMNRLVRLAHVARAAVAVRVHGNRREAHFAARADDPNGDLAAVGDEDFHEAPQRQAGDDRTVWTGLGI